VEVFGIQPGSSYPHPITEFRCAAQAIANAVTAEQGYDAFVIGHFQDAGLARPFHINEFSIERTVVLRSASFSTSCGKRWSDRTWTPGECHD
jgi:allantoin racemase